MNTTTDRTARQVVEPNAAREIPHVFVTQFDQSDAWQAMAWLMDQAVENNWLPGWSDTLVVHVAQKGPSPLVEKIGYTVARYLRARGRYREVLLWDQGGFPLPGHSAQDGESQHGQMTRPTLMSPCLPYGLPIDMALLQSFDLLVVASAAPDSQCGLSAILATQAGILGEDRAWWPELIAEAHRLARADVALVCGPSSWGGSGGRVFCAVSNNDIALEVAIARAAGGQPERLPHLQFLSGQMAASLEWPKVTGELPDLRGYLAPVWMVHLVSTWWHFARLVQIARADLSLARSNMHRVPKFLARRLPRRGSSR